MTNKTDSRQRLLRIVSLGIILGIILFWVITTLHGLLIEDYSHVEYALSTLGMQGAPFAFVSRFAFILLGLSMLAFGWLIRQQSKANKFASFAATVLLFVHGIGRIGEGIFAWNPEVPGAMSNRLHNIFGAPGVIVMVFIPFAVIWAFKNISRWPLRSYTAITGIVFTGAFLAGVVGSNLGLTIPLGLAQRAGFAIWYIWALILSYHFFRHSDNATA